MCYETLQTWRDCACRKRTIKLCNVCLDSASDEGSGEAKKAYFEECGKREGVREMRRGRCGRVGCMGDVGEGEDIARAGHEALEMDSDSGGE